MWEREPNPPSKQPRPLAVPCRLVSTEARPGRQHRSLAGLPTQSTATLDLSCAVAEPIIDRLGIRSRGKPWQFGRRENWQGVSDVVPPIAKHIASNLPPAHRARLLKTAGHCRMLADDIDEPRSRRSPVEALGASARRSSQPVRHLKKHPATQPLDVSLATRAGEAESAI
jgi:hypothetical protein